MFWRDTKSVWRIWLPPLIYLVAMAIVFVAVGGPPGQGPFAFQSPVKVLAPDTVTAAVEISSPWTTADAAQFPRRTNTALVSFQFDDGLWPTYYIAYPVLAAKGVPGNAALVSSCIGADTNFLSVTQIQTLHDAGWEIVAHSKTHPHIRELSDAQLYDETKGCKSALEALGFRVNFFVVPFLDSTLTVRRKVLPFFRGIIGLGQSPAAKASNIPPLKNDSLVCMDTYDTTPLADYTAAVDDAIARGSWAIFLIEQITETNCYVMGQAIDYIKSKNVPIVTFTQAMNRLGNYVESPSLRVGAGDLNGAVVPHWLDVGHDPYIWSAGTPAEGELTTALLGISDGIFTNVARLHLVHDANHTASIRNAAAQIGLSLGDFDGDAHAGVPTNATFAGSYLHIGGGEYRTGGMEAITFGYHSTASPATNVPAYIAYVMSSASDNTRGPLVFGTRSATTDTEPDNLFFMGVNGGFGIGCQPTNRLDVPGSAVVTGGLGVGIAAPASGLALSTTGAVTSISSTIAGKPGFALDGDPAAVARNALGYNAVDHQLGRNAATKIASGESSTIGGGTNNTASGLYSTVAGGTGNGTSGNYSTVPGGFGNTANGSYSIVAGGLYGIASLYGELAHAAGCFKLAGDAESRHWDLRNRSTNAVSTNLFLDGCSVRLVMPTNTTWNLRGMISARQIGTGGGVKSAGYEFKAVCHRDYTAASMTLDYSLVTTQFETDALWDVTLSADTTNGALNIIVTGNDEAMGVQWLCTVDAANCGGTP